MRCKGMNRRQFLETTEAAAAGVAVLSLVTGVVAPGGARAMSLGALDPHTAETLVRVCRLAYPHDFLGDMYYAAAVEGLDAKAAKDAKLAKLLKDGVAGLDAAFPPRFLDLSDGNQLKAVKEVASSPFFQTVRGHMVVALYNNKLVWRHFGYEGASAPFGGYIDRGFDDINWLPRS